MEWRARWRAATKTGSPLFDGVTSDWNVNQTALAFWFSFYDNIFEHPERPDMSIINNDDLLDKWVEQKSKEMEDRARKHGTSSKNGMSAYDHPEVVVFGEEVIEEDEEYEEEE